jgi:FixJ family two-component response regulator
MPGVVVVVDDDQHILDALGMWLDQRQQNAAYYHLAKACCRRLT